MATEQEELRLTVNLVDNASAGIAKLRSELQQLGGGQNSQHMERFRRETSTITNLVKLLGGEASNAWKMFGLFRAGIGTAAGGLALFGYEITKGMAALKEYSDKLRDLGQQARTIGADPVQLRYLIDHFKQFGISAETVTNTVKGMNEAIADLTRQGSELRQKLLMRAGPEGVAGMEEFIGKLVKARDETERFALARAAGENVYRNALKETGSTIEANNRKQQFYDEIHYNALLDQAEQAKKMSGDQRLIMEQQQRQAEAYATAIGKVESKWEHVKDLLMTPFRSAFFDTLTAGLNKLAGILDSVAKGAEKALAAGIKAQGGLTAEERASIAGRVDSGQQTIARTTEELMRSLEGNSEQLKQLNNFFQSKMGAQPMSYSPVGGPMGGMLQQASYQPGGGGGFGAYPGGGYNAAGGGEVPGGGTGGYGGTAPNGQTAGPGTGTGAGATPPMGGAAAGGAGLAAVRSGQMKELADPAVRDRLMAYTEAEVGSQGPQAKQAFMETILNRAAARNQSVASTLSGSYFPKETHARAAGGVTDAQREAYSGMMADVMGGSNLSNFATGNASGRVGFGGGPKTFSAGGENYGIEKQDLAWASKMRTGQGGTATGAPDLSSRTLAGYGPHGYERRKGEPGEFNWAATGALGAPGPGNQTTIQLKNGKNVQVNAAVAERYKGFLNELIDRGYPVDSVGGYNYRGKAGGGGMSMHSYGAAVDINPGRNQFRGSTTDMPGDVEDMAWKHGLSWGGRFGDPMHFEPMSPSAWANKQKILDARRQVDSSSAATKVEGSGKITVDVNAPKGTTVGAEGKGLFKETEVNRQTQMEPAAQGPTDL